MDQGGTTLQGRIISAGRLDRALAEACTGVLPGGGDLSRERVKALIGEGRVTVDGRLASSASLKVAPGAGFAITLPQVAQLETVAQDIPLTIVHEDEHLIVIDKPAGMVVHPAAGNPDGTLVNALLHHCAGRLSGIGGVARPGIVHRIDKDTSGLLVVAKSDAAHEGLARQFADHSIERAYLAITHGVPVPAQGTLKGTIARHHTDRKRMAIMPEEEARYVAPYGTPEPVEEPSHRGKHAVTHYRLREAMGKSALVECRLETGRTHQVRVHMASIGHPLVGDPVYCRSQKSLKPLLLELNFSRQSLHAAVLGFIHPVTGETLRFASDLPADMRDLLARLGSFHADQPGYFLPEPPQGVTGTWPPPKDAC
ncbi:MAG: RluA family pseudouridine synthase [Sphingomonadales bacterium]|nr:RluA family pseudouridine synthase [Sphingomonadales bacterium]MDE2168256.1 RluA family pseudouridine synthase [Sphingomonadales bacterium]